MQPLSPEEQDLLASLMKRVTFPAPLKVFNAWCENFTTDAVEIALLKSGDQGREIFLIYRDDPYYKGWHIPGSIVRPGEQIATALERVIIDEIKTQISKQDFFKWYERMKGNGPVNTPRGQELALLFVAKESVPLQEKDDAKFFSLNNLPADLIEEHRLPCKDLGTIS